MLQMRPSCECCDRDLAPDSTQARICSFECTWCARCSEECLGGVCPNCGGAMVQRPPRAAELLETYPASHERVHQLGLHRGG
jgi:hypothetical protein